MKKVFVFFIVLNYSVITLATQQENDVIIYIGHNCELGVTYRPSPLLAYYEVHPEKKYPFTMLSTANYRGYVATWEIKHGELLLSNIEREHGYGLDAAIEPVPLGKIFEGKVLDGKVKADWFTGFLVIQCEYKKFFKKDEMIVIAEVHDGAVVSEHSYNTEDFYEILRDKREVSQEERDMFDKCFPKATPPDEFNEKDVELYAEKDFNFFLKRHDRDYDGKVSLMPLTDFCIVKDVTLKNDCSWYLVNSDIIASEGRNLLVFEMGESNLPPGPWSTINWGAVLLVLKINKLVPDVIDLSTVEKNDIFVVNNYANYKTPQSVSGKIEILNVGKRHVDLSVDIDFKSQNPSTLQEIEISNSVFPVYTLTEYLELHEGDSVSYVMQRQRKYKELKKSLLVENDLFAGRWEGNGEDANGNSFVFVATVTDTGENQYRMLILQSFDSQKPMHTMDGTLEGSRFIYTADGGVYTGACELEDGLLTGYYKGPVDGSFQMRRVDSEL